MLCFEVLTVECGGGAGHSRAQGVPRAQRKTTVYLDAKLSRQGHGQARDIARQLASGGGAGDASSPSALWQALRAVELVVVSPLTRALQTACCIFQHVAVPIVCHPAVAEIGKIPENQARSLKMLRRDKDLSALPRFHSVDFSLIEALEDCWPMRRQELPRQSASRVFLRWLVARPERNVVLVSHHNYLQGLAETTHHIANCAPFRVVVTKQGGIETHAD